MLHRLLNCLAPCFTLLIAQGLGLTSSKPTYGAERPNIIIILTDDQGYGDVSTYHPSDVRTPHIDALAASGMRFDQMRANCTVCSPSRAALLTGRFPDRVGVPGVIRTHAENSWGYLTPTVPTLANVLGEAGYHTAIVGKWHLGLEHPNTPNDRGFDHFRGFLGDMMDSYTDHRRHGNNYMRLNGTEIDPAGHATDLFASWASDYIRERAANQSQPFFLYLAFNAPHFPIEPPAEWLERVQKRNSDLSPARTKNVAFVEHLDDRIGQVLATLEETGLAKNTFVAMSADNGGSLPHAQNNDPWRDGKQSHYDGGLKVPFMVRWPEHVKAGSVCEYQGLVFDLFPTCVDIAGAKLPDGLDAVSLLPALQGQTMPAGRELYFVRREGGRNYGGLSYEAIVKDDWKLMRNSPYEPLQLYHLKSDPGETNNLAAKERQKFNELADALRLHTQRGGAVAWQSK